MHNFERILAQMIHSLTGNQDLQYEMTSAQNRYRLNYYWIKYKSMVDSASLVKSAGKGNFESPDSLISMMANILTRAGVMCKQLYYRLWNRILILIFVKCHFELMSLNLKSPQKTLASTIKKVQKFLNYTNDSILHCASNALISVKNFDLCQKLCWGVESRKHCIGDQEIKTVNQCQKKMQE